MSKESKIDKLANSEDRYVRSRVAARPNLPLNIMVKLADDEDSYVKRNLALNRSTPPSILAKLADNKDDTGFVSSLVALNKNTPPSALAKLANNRYARYALAHNVKTPPSTLAKLAKSTSSLEDVTRMIVAENPNTPIEALKILTKDKDDEVRRRAEHNISNEYFRRLFKAANQMDSSKANSLLDMENISDPKLIFQRSLARLKWLNDATAYNYERYILPPKWHSTLDNYRKSDAKKVYRNYLAQIAEDPNKEVANEAKRIIKFISIRWIN